MIITFTVSRQVFFATCRFFVDYLPNTLSRGVAEKSSSNVILAAETAFIDASFYI